MKAFGAVRKKMAEHPMDNETAQSREELKLDFPVDSSIDLMIIDDEKMMIDLLVDLFTNDWENINVKAFTISEKAIQYLQQNTVDIIITDLMMPKFSGLDVLREAKRLHPEVLVVLITAYGSLETTLEAIRYGAYDYLTKPFQVQEFELMVNNAIERIYLNRELTLLRSENQRLINENCYLGEEVSQLSKQILKLEHERTQEERVLGPRGMSVSHPASEMTSAELSQYTKLSPSPREQLKNELEKLSQMKREGRLNDTEYEDAKRKLLKSYFPG